MAYRRARREVATRCVIGILVMLLSLLLLVPSSLKFLYFGFGSGNPVLAPLARSVQQFVYVIYERTQFFSIFWNITPIPDVNVLNKPGNYVFLLFYMTFFVGLATLTSAISLARRLRRIRMEVEDDIIRDSLRGRTRPNREEVREEIHEAVESISIFSQIHALYIAPLVVGLVLLAVTWLLGLL